MNPPPFASDPLADEEAKLAMHAAALELRDVKNRLNDTARHIRNARGPDLIGVAIKRVAADLERLENLAWARVGTTL